MRSFLALVLVAARSTFAQRPSNVSICDYYSNALLGASNATSQYTLLTLLVNTAVIGNYTTPNQLAVPGILASNATYNGTKVNLLPYFDGSLKSTNVGKEHGVSVNFLDGGGAAPLAKSKPASDKTSHQYTLLTHLYSFFGLLLGCSDYGMSGFSAYKGDKSMYEVHKFMDLDPYQVQYFIEQVGLSAASFGVATEDVMAVGEALQGLFGVKCAPKTSVNPAWKSELQSICISSDCPLSPNSTCGAYGPLSKPAPSSSMTTSSGSSGGESGKPTAGGTSDATGLRLPLYATIFLAGGLAMLMI